LAEVWKPAGSSFSCNKDLFGFSLLNQTSTVAVVGIGGGTVVGAGIGAIAGHGKRDFNCGIKSHREQLTKELRAGGKIGTLNEFLSTVDRIPVSGPDLTEYECNSVVELFDLYQQGNNAIKNCDDGSAAILGVEAQGISGSEAQTLANDLINQINAQDIDKECERFKPINRAMNSGGAIYCPAGAPNAECITRTQFDAQLAHLGGALS